MMLDQLYQDLKAPPLGAINIDGALDLWHFTDYSITCIRPDVFEETPDLAARLRGGMGQALKIMAAKQAPYSKRKNIRAYDVLYTPLITVGRDEVPHPFVIRAETLGEFIKIDLRLFGFANFWGDEAADALVSALEKGIALKQDGRLRVPLHIQHIMKKKTSYLEAKYPLNYAKLRFKSPLCLRQNEAVSITIEGVFAAIERRIHSLMPWQGFVLSTLLPPFKLKLQESDMVKIKWMRHSVKQGQTPILMQGFLGDTILEGDISALSPWLNLASSANIGSHTSLGLGWFEFIGV